MVQPPRKNDAHNVQDYSALQLTDSGQRNAAIWRERMAQRDPSDNQERADVGSDRPATIT